MPTAILPKLLLLPLVLAVGAQSGDWPPADLAVGAAFDDARSRLVIVGSSTDSGAPLHTWEWDGAAWTRHRGPGPSARLEPALAYDRARRKIVLYGGGSGRGGGGQAGDTWEWDGARWRQVDSGGPPVRGDALMTYDSRRRRVVLFGGGRRVSSGGETPAWEWLNDTWEWDGRRWSQASENGRPDSPPGRVLGGIAYDEARGRVVLTGGFYLEGGRAISLGDTWEWDGRQWRQVGGDGPGARDHHSMAYDAARQAVVLHGGIHPETGPRTDSWIYDGTSWRPLGGESPARARHRLVYDSRRRTTLWYGGVAGRQRTNELWRLDGDRWVRIGPSGSGSP